MFPTFFFLFYISAAKKRFFLRGLLNVCYLCSGIK